jgi:hypothetical protein
MKAFKAVSKLVLVAMTFAVIISVQGCKDEVPETDRVKGILKASTWTMQTVVVDAVDQSTVYKGLTLNFTDTGYSSTNGGVVWPASGTWVFADASAKTITRNDNLAITITEVTDAKLILSLTWAKTTLAGGRIESVKGLNVFTFTK